MDADTVAAAGGARAGCAVDVGGCDGGWACEGGGEEGEEEGEGGGEAHCDGVGGGWRWGFLFGLGKGGVEE